MHHDLLSGARPDRFEEASELGCARLLPKSSKPGFGKWDRLWPDALYSDKVQGFVSRADYR